MSAGWQVKCGGEGEGSGREDQAGVNVPGFLSGCGYYLSSSHLAERGAHAKTGDFISIGYRQDGISEGGLRKGRTMYVILFK